MSANRVLWGVLALALVSAPGFAQDSKPSPVPAPKSPSPMAAPKASTTGAATPAVTAKVNLNTASEADLAKLPKISSAQAKAIVEARTKAKFKSYDDFLARKVVPADTAAGLKETVTF